MILLVLFGVFFKVGFFTFGGGLSIIPFLQNMVDTYGWFTNEELSSIIALAQMTPGAIGVNMATYAGINGGGIVGGVMATLGLCGVSLIVPPMVMRVWGRVQKYPMALSVFNALKVVVTGLIAGVLVTMTMDLFEQKDGFVFKPVVAGLFILGVLLNLKFKVNNIAFILLFGVLGIVFQL